MFKGNKIYKIDKNGQRKRVFFIKGLKIMFKGSNTTVYVHEPFPKFSHCKLQLGDNNRVEICSSKFKLKRFELLATAPQQEFYMGKNCSATNGLKILLHKSRGLKVSIGDDCMFGTNVILRTSDAHSLVNLSNNRIENPSKGISIGNHCWIAMNVTILKGVNMADNTVVGTGSMVTKDCSVSNAVYAGTPARLVKENIQWVRECLG